MGRLNTVFRLYLAALAMFVLLAAPASAGLIGGPVWLTGPGMRFPDVAYDSADGKYLAVWPYDAGRTAGRFVSNGGALLGNAFYISDGAAYALYPAIAYNATNNEFLVTWDDGRGGDTIWGQRVRASDGALLGGNFQISTTPSARSAVAWSSTSNCYLVVSSNFSEVYARRVSNTGALLGSEMNLSNDAGFSGYPAVSYNAAGNQFLATWDDSSVYEGSITGQRIDASTGNLLGGKFYVVLSGAERSNSACDPVNARWMVTYEDEDNVGYSRDQGGQLVSSDGSFYGGWLPIAHTTAFEGETLLGCDVAYCGGSPGRFVQIFQRDNDVCCQEVLPSGANTGSQVVLAANMGGDISGAGDPNLGRFLAVFANFDGANYSVVCQLYGITADPAPGPVTNFVVYSGNQQNNLTWTNPVESDFTGTMIRYRTDAYPTSPTDGTLVVNKSGTPGANDSYLHTGLTNGVGYYYTAFAHDSTGPNYSVPKYGSGTPTSPACFQDSFAYPDGNLNGNGGWTGTAGSQISVVSQTVRILGGATAMDAIRTVSCGDPGAGFITVTVNVQSGVGTDYMWDLWIDDASNLNLARWYGSGTTARGRIGGTTSVTATQTLTGGWDTLKVQINPYTNTTEFFFNGNSIGVLDHGQTGAGDTVGRLRFTRGTTSAVDGNYLFFDNLAIGDTADTTPPGNVTSFTATSGDTQNSLSWANPADSDFAGVKIMFKTTGYPTGPTDGTQCYSGMGTSTVHSGLTNGVTYYYKAFAFDEVPNYASGAQASAVPADVTAPGNVTSFTATSGDTQNSLSWANPGDGDFAGVKIMFKTTGYPTGPTDGTQCYNGAGTSTVHTGLTNGVTYYYKAFAYDEVPNYASGSQASAVPADVTAPGNVTSFTATSGDTQNSLSWANPGDGDFAGVKIMFKTTGYPTGPTDGTQCYSGTGTSTIHTGLTNGVTYYYKAFAFDEVPNYASGSQASAVPADVTPPGPVTSFTATSGDTQNSLSWANPGGDFAGVKIMFKTTGYPSSPTDGTQCYNSTGTSYVHTGLTNGTTYYYSAYAYDEVPNYASAAQANGTPVSSESTLNIKEAGSITVDGSSSDWSLGDFTTKIRGGQGGTGDIALVGYDGGSLYYSGYWTGGVLPTSATDHTAKVYSRHNESYLYFLVRCDDSDMRYSNPASANWANDCVEFYIDPSHNHGSSAMSDSTSDIQLVIDANNQKNVYMCTSGYASQVLAGVTSAVVRDGTGWWLEVRIQKTAIDPDIGSVGTIGVDFNFRDNDNDNDPTQTTVYCWSDPTQGEGFPSKIPDNWGDGSLVSVPVTISSSTFDSDANGWTISVWKSGPYADGTMVWSSSAGNPGGGMRCQGSGDSDNTDRCTREGGEIKKTISTVGYSNINVSYNLKVNTLGKSRTGTGAGSCTVDHNLIDEQLTVFYSTNGGTNWTEANYITRSTLLGYQSYGTRTIDLSGVSGCNNNSNFALRFRWQLNSIADTADLDNIKVTGNQ